MPSVQEVNKGSKYRKYKKKDVASGYVLVFRSLLTQQILQKFFLWFLTGFPLILYIPQNSSCYGYVTY